MLASNCASPLVPSPHEALAGARFMRTQPQ
jgi:hypothetical protein